MMGFWEKLFVACTVFLLLMLADEAVTLLRRIAHNSEKR